MIEPLAQKIAVALKNMNPNETASIQVMKFSLIMVIGTSLTIMLSLLISSIIGTLNEAIMVMVSFVILRLFSGGYHFKSAELCVLSSISIIVLTPLISISNVTNIIIQSLSIVIILLVAPIGINQSKYFKPRHYPILKTISILLVISNFVMDIDVVSLSFFIQSITLLIEKGKEVN